jgi:hypothetical protein
MREVLPPLKWTWYDGGKDKPKWVVKAEGLRPRIKLSAAVPPDRRKGTHYSPNDYGEVLFDLRWQGSDRELPDCEEYRRRRGTLPGGETWFVCPRSCTTELVMSGSRHPREHAGDCDVNFTYAGPLTPTSCSLCRPANRQESRVGRPEHERTPTLKKNRYLKREYARAGNLTGACGSGGFRCRIDRFAGTIRLSRLPDADN